MTPNEIITIAENEIKELYDSIDENALFNQEKVLNAFQTNNVGLRHFSGTTGYGYDDIGRDTLNRIFAQTFDAEDALVSPNIVSGTHALTLMLFGILRPNDNLLAISGMPYDTLEDVLIGENKGSLKDFGVNFDKVDLLVDGDEVTFDLDSIANKFSEKPIKAVFIQRSRGYNWRQAISVESMEEVIRFVKRISPKTIVMVDNCYGAFVQKIEPTSVGADIMAGSLIKNAGGGFAVTGGYLAGTKTCVEQVSYRLTSPSIGSEVGSYAYGYLPFYQGFFMAPTTVKNALKSSALFAKCYSILGYETLPKSNCQPYDIVTSIKFGDKQKLIDFCRTIQYASPVDSNLMLEPWDMPGYQHQVIMAAGTFVQGASIELSADAPIVEPYIAYLQGSLNYEHAKIALKMALKDALKSK